MRVFIGIEFSEKIKEYLHEIQCLITNYSERGNFTRKENFHLTLRFIGEVDTNQIQILKRVIDKTSLEQNCFQLVFKKLGYFPRGNRMIIWMGLKESETLKKLYYNLELGLEEEGYSKEDRSFTPHITLGREVIIKEDFNKLAEKIKTDNINIFADKISLMESARVNNRLTYKPIYVSEFRQCII